MASPAKKGSSWWRMGSRKSRCVPHTAHSHDEQFAQQGCMQLPSACSILPVLGVFHGQPTTTTGRSAQEVQNAQMRQLQAPLMHLMWCVQYIAGMRLGQEIMLGGELRRLCAAGWARRA